MIGANLSFSVTTRLTALSFMVNEYFPSSFATNSTLSSVTLSTSYSLVEGTTNSTLELYAA